jgi:hypothetical protein
MDDRILRMSKRELRARVQELETLHAAPIVCIGRLCDFSYSSEVDYVDVQTHGDVWQSYLPVLPPRQKVELTLDVEHSTFTSMYGTFLNSTRKKYIVEIKELDDK